MQTDDIRSASLLCMSKVTLICVVMVGAACRQVSYLLGCDFARKTLFAGVLTFVTKHEKLYMTERV